MESVVQAEHLRKVYGSNVAVQDISFTVHKGEIFGILGPNGAGKTTTVEMIMGLRQPTSGSVRVLGFDPRRQGHELRQVIGVQLQQASLPDRLKVWEALDLFSSFYKKSVDWRGLLQEWGLEEKRNTAFGRLSGGQKQRVFIALALVNDPQVVFLDELTTGLDPQARRHTWELVRAVRERGKTVVLVTHFMDEAENLCDRLAIVDKGRIVALDTPQALIRQVQGENRVRFTANGQFQVSMLETVPSVSRVTQSGNDVVVYGDGALLAHVAARLAEFGIAPDDLHADRANLEDVFLALTGNDIRN
ncbi:MAG: ABC transporter ATP-binding protein [Anaerolineales bacterium]|nr:ABC transporter ATP-binding protein [Anaerolineales bacterium]MCB8953032.1 ABC transporter ATP-binding protein [Ardenticatenales bacterium]